MKIKILWNFYVNRKCFHDFIAFRYWGCKQIDLGSGKERDYGKLQFQGKNRSSSFRFSTIFGSIFWNKSLQLHKSAHCSLFSAHWHPRIIFVARNVIWAVDQNVSGGVYKFGGKKWIQQFKIWAKKNFLFFSQVQLLTPTTREPKGMLYQLQNT